MSEIRDLILAKADKLLCNPNIGQLEEYLEHLGKSHRRVIEGNHKIIYKVESETIYITDIFDSRQDPEKMKGWLNNMSGLRIAKFINSLFKNNCALIILCLAFAPAQAPFQLFETYYIQAKKDVEP